MLVLFTSNFPATVNIFLNFKNYIRTLYAVEIIIIIIIIITKFV